MNQPTPQTIAAGKVRLQQQPDGSIVALHDVLRVSLLIEPHQLERWVLSLFRRELTTTSKKDGIL